MNCPLCGFENIEGDDWCAKCRTDLADAGGDARAADIERDLLNRPLGDLVTDNFVEVPPNRSVRDTVKACNEGGYHCAIVVSDGKVVGMFTERDVLLKLADDYEQRADAPISDFMTHDPVMLNIESPLAFALNRMMVGGYRHIPVCRDGKLAGIVSVRDAVAYMVERFPEALPAEPVA